MHVVAGERVDSKHVISTCFHRYLPNTVNSASHLHYSKQKQLKTLCSVQADILTVVLENYWVHHSHILLLEWTAESTIVRVGISCI